MGLLEDFWRTFGLNPLHLSFPPYTLRLIRILRLLTHPPMTIGTVFW